MSLSSFTRLAALGATVIAVGGSAAAFSLRPAPAEASPPTAITVYKTPTCGCCSAWIDHLKENGFAVTAKDVPDLTALKRHYGVTQELASCHTGFVNGYVIEGHVPADAITKLLREAPRAKGLAVPGMPVGSPGMEGGEPESYEVVLFDAAGSRTFARYRGAVAL
jgi:hypothetical protein